MNALLFEIWKWVWPLIAGYGYCLFIGGWFVKMTMIELNRKIRLDTFSNDNQRNAYFWYPQAVGRIEGIVYVTCLLMGHGEFIVAWLALKVAGRWESHTLEHSLDQERVKEKPLFLKLIINNGLCNNFAIGSALSVIYAGISWKMILWLRNGGVYKTILTIIVSAMLNWWFINLSKEQTSLLEQIEADKKQKSTI